MKIITISREFGSGGRELGKRLAEALGFAYYDAEILKAIAEKSGLAEEYVNDVVEKTSMWYMPITYANTFSCYNLHEENYFKVIRAQTEVIKELADKSDCVFVGRCADAILSELSPLNIFVHANTESKVIRCRKKAPEHEHLTDKQLRRKIKAVEAKRRYYYKTFTHNKWGDKEHYNLCVNTSNKEIKDLIPALAEYCKAFFG